MTEALNPTAPPLQPRQLELHRRVYIAVVVDALRARDCWTSTDHLQHAIHLSEHLFPSLPLNYGRIFYKLAPKSFELADEIAEMCSDRLLVLEPDLTTHYAPRLNTTPHVIDALYQNTLFQALTAQCGYNIDAVVQLVADTVAARPIQQTARMCAAAWFEARLGLTESYEVAALVRDHCNLREHPDDMAEAFAAVRALESAKRGAAMITAAAQEDA